MNFFLQNGRLLKKTFLILMPWVVISNQWDLFFSDKLENLLRSTEPLSSNAILWLYGGLLLLGQLVFPLLLSLITLWGLSKHIALIHFIKNHTSLLFRETLRSWGKSLFWALFFILPGLIRFFQLLLVPYVVVFSAPYQAGQLDAQKASTTYVGQRWKTFLAIFVVFNFFLPLFLTITFDEQRNLFETPLQSLILSAVDTYLHLLCAQFIYMVFEKLQKKGDGHEFAISTPRN